MKKKFLLAAFLVFTVRLQVWQICAESDPGESHFKFIVESVNKLASGLVEIYEHACGEEDNVCDCSQDMCKLLPPGSNPVCFPSKIENSNLYNCSAILAEKMGNGAKSCSSIRVISKSSVTYVRSSVDENPDEGQTRTICRTQKLDTVFQDVQSTMDIYTNFYVGMIDGTRRSFPGREEVQESCAQYDSRTRPWYSGAISHPNHLVILIDNGDDMTAPPGLGTITLDRIDFASEFASSLMETVYKDSFVNVFSFGGRESDSFVSGVISKNFPIVALLEFLRSGKPTFRNMMHNNESSILLQTPVRFNISDPQSHPELDHLKQKIMDLHTNTSTTSTLPSQFADALNISMMAFDETKSKVGLQNLVIFTDGSFTGDPSFSDQSVTDVIKQIQSRGVRVFIYGMNGDFSADGLRRLSQQLNGFFQDEVYSLSGSDRLLNMQSYFGFMATSHKNLYNDTPFWSPNYRDYYNVGEIVTVTKPVIIKNGIFVGVAAIDVILSELTNEISSSFQTAVLSQQQYQDRQSKDAPNQNTTAAAIPGMLDDSSCKTTLQPTDVLCKAPTSTGTVPKCCNICSVSGEKIPAVKIIVGVVSGVVLLFVVAIGTIIYLYKPKKQEVAQPNVPVDRAMENDPRWNVAL